MKKMKTILAVAILLSVTNTFATIRYVNNQPPYPSGPATLHYTSFGAAQTASSSGDTILIQGSPVTYGDMGINKSITIIGPGFNTTSYNGYESVFVNVYCQSDSVNLIGIKAGLIYYYAGANLVRIKRCETQSIGHSGTPSIDKLTVEECFLTGFPFASSLNAFNGWDSNSGQLTNLTFRNNVVNGTLANFNGLNAATCVFSNNVFVRKGSNLSGERFLDNVQNATFVNNIFLSTYGTGNYNNVVNCQFTKNVIYGSTQTFPSGPGPNYINQNPVMVNQPSGAGAVTYTHDLHLTTSSPDSVKGVDGLPNTSDDIGLFGGIGYFTMTGNPPIPIIEKLQISNPVVSGGTLLNINFVSRRKQ